MKRFLPWVTCVICWVSACSPTGPTSPTLLEPPPREPTNRGAYRQANWQTPTMFTSIAASGQMSSQVTDADPLCDPRGPTTANFSVWMPLALVSSPSRWRGVRPVIIRWTSM